jgi:hypothetical protein
MKNEFEEELAGFRADLTWIPQQLIEFLIKEVSEDTKDAITLLTR